MAAAGNEPVVGDVAPFASAPVVELLGMTRGDRRVVRPVDDGEGRPAYAGIAPSGLFAVRSSPAVSRANSERGGYEDRIAA